MHPTDWLPLFADEAEAPFLNAVSFWSRRAFCAGRTSCGDLDALAELRRLDRDAAAFHETTAAALDGIPERNP